jgi:hypothetical protein
MFGLPTRTLNLSANQKTDPGKEANFVGCVLVRVAMLEVDDSLTRPYWRRGSEHRASLLIRAATINKSLRRWSIKSF